MIQLNCSKNPISSKPGAIDFKCPPTKTMHKPRQKLDFSDEKSKKKVKNRFSKKK
jgi:hypothetical protein